MCAGKRHLQRSYLRLALETVELILLYTYVRVLLPLLGSKSNVCGKERQRSAAPRESRYQT